MPISTQSFTVPPNTSQSNPARLDFLLGGRKIAQIGVYFPPGCFGAVGIRLKDMRGMIAPITGDWVTGDNVLIQWPENRIITGPPWRLTLEGYSIADDFNHTVSVYLVTV